MIPLGLAVSIAVRILSYLIDADVLEGKIEDSDPDDRNTEGEGEHQQDYGHLQLPGPGQDTDGQYCTDMHTFCIAICMISLYVIHICVCLSILHI